MELGLKGKKAIVTGGATGLGRCFVEMLAAEGVEVAFSYHDAKGNLEAIEKAAAMAGGRAVGLMADLSDASQVLRFFDEARQTLGQVDILINNAGRWMSGYVTELAPEDWDAQMAINLRAPFLLCREFARAAEASGHGGHVLNVTSQAAYYGSTTGHSHYATSKAGLIAFNASFAREQAKKGINSNNICIGIMNTRMIQKNLDKNPDYYVDRIPVGRVAEPEEIARIGTLLVSDVFSYMTGATIDVTGGMLMH